MTNTDLADKIARRLAEEFSIREPTAEIAAVILEELNTRSTRTREALHELSELKRLL